MFYSDSLMRKRYAYDEVSEAAGIRVVEKQSAIADQDQQLALDQCIISISFVDARWQYETTKSGTKRIAVTAGHVFKYDTSFADPHMTDEERLALVASHPTYNMVLARSEEIFMRGTLWQDAWWAYQASLDVEPFASEDAPTTNRGIVIDPFNSPLFTDLDAPDASLIGTYNPASPPRPLNDAPPIELQRVGDVVWRWPARKVPKQEEVEPTRDWAVLYGVKATYEVQIRDRENMSVGGPHG